ncbi:hypothetical protein CMO89_02260 [Candidatus Woesearchaeota archaeon]|nr:hypothetical protein [Candidatus Woesearchaeota archaeon]
MAGKRGEVDSKKVFVVFFLIILAILLSGSFYTKFVQERGVEGAVKKELLQEIDVDQILIKVLIKSNEFLNRSIRVMNIGSNASDIGVEASSSMEEIVSVKENSFVLKPGQTKVLPVIFSAFDKEKRIEHIPDVYIGKLNVKSGEHVKVVPLIVEIESKNILFDMNLNPLARERTIYSGDKVTIEVRLFNLEEIKPVNIEMEYYVKDLDGNTIISESETVVVQKQASFFKTINIPDNFKSENYVFTALAKYGSSTGTASYLFEVAQAEKVVIEKGIRFSPSYLCNSDPFCWVTFYMIIFVVFALGACVYFFIGGWLYNKLNAAFSKKYKKKVLDKREKQLEEMEKAHGELLKIKDIKFKQKVEERKRRSGRFRRFLHSAGFYKSERERRELERERRELERERKLRRERRRQERQEWKRERLREGRKLKEEKEKLMFEEEKRKIEEEQRRLKERKKLDEFKEREEEKKTLEEEKRKKEENKRLGELREKEENKERLEEKRRIEREKEKRAIARRERTRRLHGLLRRVGLYKRKEEKKREERKREKKLREKEREKAREEELRKKAAQEEERIRKEREEKERIKADKEERKRRKKELKLRSKLSKKTDKFRLLARKAEGYVEEKRADMVVGSYSKLKAFYDKLIALPLKAEVKKELYSKLNNVYLWVRREKQTAIERSERKRKIRLEKIRRREEERRKREEVERKLGERRRLEEIKRRNEREKEERKREEEEKGLLEERRKERERKRNEKERERLKKERERLKKEREKRKAAAREERKKKMHALLHRTGLYKTEEERRKEKRERLRKLREKERERKRILNEEREKEAEIKRLEEVKRKEESKRLEELKRKEEEKNRADELRKEREEKRRLRELRQKEKEEKRKQLEISRKQKERERLEEQRRKENEEKELRAKELLEKRLVRFNSTFSRIERLIKNNDVDGVAASYAALKGIYSKLILSQLSREQKAVLYNRLKDAYEWMVGQKQKEIAEIKRAKEEKEKKRGKEKEKEKRKEKGKEGMPWKIKGVKPAAKKGSKDSKGSKGFEDSRGASSEEEELSRKEAELERKEREQLKKFEELMKK